MVEAAGARSPSAAMSVVSSSTASAENWFDVNTRGAPAFAAVGTEVLTGAVDTVGSAAATVDVLPRGAVTAGEAVDLSAPDRAAMLSLLPELVPVRELPVATALPLAARVRPRLRAISVNPSADAWPELEPIPREAAVADVAAALGVEPSGSAAAAAAGAALTTISLGTSCVTDGGT